MKCHFWFLKRVVSSVLILLLTVGFLSGQSDTCDYVIRGKVLDISSEQPLPFATIIIQETGQGAVADANGDFQLDGICNGEIHLEISYIGYKTVIHHHDFYHDDPTIYLASDQTLLESVVIEGSRLGAFKSLTVQNLEINKVSLLNTSIGDLSQRISGVSILKTGSNISKPMIHGLHSNRVLVMNDGLRHAYQVWGEGHAPEIDPSHVNEIEVVKGAGTVKYGPEALGGVILYNSKRPELDTKLHGSVGSSYQTNGGAYSGQVNVSQGSHRFAWRASGFGVVQGDLQAPDYNLSNTGKKEYGGSFNTLFHQRNFELEVSGSYLDQELGILRGSLVGNLDDLQNAIERSVPNPTFESTYEIQNPRHDIQHGAIKSDLSLFLGDHIVKAQYGFQRNIRKEFDVRRGELNNRPVIDLALLSHNVGVEWIQPRQGNWSGYSGIQFFSQSSVNEPGSNPINFVPDYDVLNVGAYSIQSLNIDQSIVELGLRLDYQSLSVIDTVRDVLFYNNEVDFTNATFTLGYKNELSESLTLFSNVGTAWRPPNVSELYSFGYHFSRIQFGLWRYSLDPQISTPLNRVFDETDREVRSERSLKWVTGLEFRNDRLDAEAIFYINRINDYIFLRPYGVTTNVAGTFPYFIFSQTNALFYGSDWDIRYRHTPELISQAKISYVYAIETENDQPFIEIPPLNINYSIEYAKGSWSGGLNLNYMAQQWHAPRVIEPASFQGAGVELQRDEIFDFMSPPDAFFLLGGHVSYQYGNLTIEIKGDNLLNASYRSYTDRLRYFANAPGRNISMTVGFEF